MRLIDRLFPRRRTPRPMATRYYDAHAIRLQGDAHNLARYQAYRQRRARHADDTMQARRGQR